MAAEFRPERSKMRPLSHNSSFPFLPPNMSELRCVLLGNSWSTRSSVGNFLLGEPKFNTEEELDSCVKVTGQIKEKEIVLVNTSDLLRPDLTEETLRKRKQECVSLSAPGPHVFLLVLQPEDFTEEQKLRLYSVLQCFGDQAIDHSLIYIATPKEESSGFTESYMDHPPLKDLIRTCRYRYLNQKNLEHPELLIHLGQTAQDHSGEHLSGDVFDDEDAGLTMTLKKPAFNLVLCGRRGAGKTSAAKAIAGQTELHSVSNPSVCVKHQVQVCGHQVSLVLLPALYGKPHEVVMEESFSCMSLCDPEGVHAFVLVLPEGPLTDDDKNEFKTIQETFRSRVNDFTMILVTVESESNTGSVRSLTKDNNFQELCQICGGRYFVLNTTDKQQIPKLLETLEMMSAKGSGCFTKEMFIKAQMENLIKVRAELHSMTQTSDENPSRECVRMVLVGRAGSGKRSTGNTILGKKHFKPGIPPMPATKSCEEARGETDGRLVAVVTTPSLFDKALPDDQVQRELRKSVRMLAPGPHAFLLVLPLGNFTLDERDDVELIKTHFGKKSVEFTIIIFTRGDDLHDLSIESYIDSCENVKKLIQECGGRYQVFNNKEDKNRTQVKELLTKIQNMVEKNGGCYKTEMLDNTEEIRQTEATRILKEKEEMKRKDEEIKLLKKKNKEQRGEIEHVERKLKAKEDEYVKECEDRKKQQQEEERRQKKQEETHRQEWRRKLEASEKRFKTEKEEKESAERKHEQYRKEMKRDRDAWDKEKKSIWEQIRQEDKEKLNEVTTSHRNLQKEYDRMRKERRYSVIALLLFLSCSLCYICYIYLSFN